MLSCLLLCCCGRRVMAFVPSEAPKPNCTHFFWHGRCSVARSLAIDLVARLRVVVVTASACCVCQWCVFCGGWGTLSLQNKSSRLRPPNWGTPTVRGVITSMYHPSAASHCRCDHTFSSTALLYSTWYHGLQTTGVQQPSNVG